MYVGLEGDSINMMAEYRSGVFPFPIFYIKLQ